MVAARQTAARQGPVWSLEHDVLYRRSATRSIEAPWLIDSPINGDRFSRLCGGVLVPTLRSGDIVIMDNLQSHKRRAVRDALRQVGTKLLFLPKYSPDLNPIEQVFAKIKHLRDPAARTQLGVSNAIAAILDTFTAEECATASTQDTTQPEIIRL
jgi:transposase